MITQLQALLIILIILELFELSWQRGDTLKKLLNNLYFFYKKGIFFFICLHPTLYFTIFASLVYNNYSFLLLCIIILKFLDLGFKINLFNQIDRNNISSAFYEEIINNNLALPLYVKAIPLFAYPLMFYFAFS